MTKRIMIKNLTKDPEQFLVKLADEVKSRTNIHWFKTGENYVVVTFDEQVRDGIMPVVKKLLRSHQTEAKAQAWITRLELANKRDVYEYFKEYDDLTILDWGNRILLVKGDKD